MVDVVGVNWWTLCQESRYWSSCAPRSVFPFWRISWSDSTLLSVEPSKGVRVTLAESLNHNLGKVSEWWYRWGMKLNAIKNETDSLQITHSASPVAPINCLRNCADEVWWPWYIDIILLKPAQRLGILRKSRRVNHGRYLLERSFRSFVLPVLECCSAEWCLVADTHHYRTVQSVITVFELWVSLSVTLYIVDLWEYHLCCTRSGVTQWDLFMVLSLGRMCRWGLHAVLWSHSVHLCASSLQKIRSITARYGWWL